MKKLLSFIFAVLLLAPMSINATENDETEEAMEVLSNDGTGTWTAINSGLTNTHVYVLAIDPSNTSIIYAGTDEGVFKSTNGGGNWTPINTGLANTTVYALTIDPHTPATIYAGIDSASDYGVVYKSTNGGGNWTPTYTGLTNTVCTALAIDPHTPATIYAGIASMNMALSLRSVMTAKSLVTWSSFRCRGNGLGRRSEIRAGKTS